jgi:hypothetical protein
LQLVDNAVHHIAEDDLVPRVVEAAAVSALNLPGCDADQDTYNSATNPLPMLPAPKCTAFMVLVWGFWDLGIWWAKGVRQSGATKEWLDGTGTRQSQEMQLASVQTWQVSMQ